MTSLKDISAICQVSVTTVSKALHGRRDVGKETRERILQTAKDLHYIPKGLGEIAQEAHRRTMNLGVLMPPMVDLPAGRMPHGGQCLNINQQEVEIIRGFCEEAMQEGYDITLLNVNDLIKKPMSYLARCRYRKLDGVFVVRRGKAMYEDRVTELMRDAMPVVTLEQIENDRSLLAVKEDAVMLGREATKDLLAAAEKPGWMDDQTPKAADKAEQQAYRSIYNY